MNRPYFSAEFTPVESCLADNYSDSEIGGKAVALCLHSGYYVNWAMMKMYTDYLPVDFRAQDNQGLVSLLNELHGEEAIDRGIKAIGDRTISAQDWIRSGALASILQEMKSRGLPVGLSVEARHFIRHFTPVNCSLKDSAHMHRGSVYREYQTLYSDDESVADALSHLAGCVAGTPATEGTQDELARRAKQAGFRLYRPGYMLMSADRSVARDFSEELLRHRIARINFEAASAVARERHLPVPEIISPRDVRTTSLDLPEMARGREADDAKIRAYYTRKD